MKGKARRSRRAVACDIPPRVKLAVWERDKGCCVACGNSRNVMPNAHYIPRSKGGLGVPENIVTLCTELTESQCHRRYDFGGQEERAAIGARIRDYLMAQYPDWDERMLYYKKGAGF